MSRMVHPSRGTTQPRTPTDRSRDRVTRLPVCEVRARVPHLPTACTRASGGVDGIKLMAETFLGECDGQPPIGTAGNRRMLRHRTDGIEFLVLGAFTVTSSSSTTPSSVIATLML